jgi:hypothetical protein
MVAIMNGKRVIFVVWAICLVLMASSGSAVETGDIDVISKKDILDEKDLQIIDKFVADAVDELVKTEDFTSISKIRAAITYRSISSRESARTQYNAQFSESARKYISRAIDDAKELTSETRRFRVIVNLLILVDSLKDLRLTDVAMKCFNDEDAIRYWAVHSVTNAGVIKQLNSGAAADSELAEKITKQLEALVESSSPEVLGLMAEFAAKVNVPGGEELLLRIADCRIKKYQNWTVEHELLDGDILKLLDGKIPSEGAGKTSVARRFGQLYSYAIQRYIKGQEVLSDAQKNQLASVLVETEASCISRILKVTQSVVKNAVEQGDFAALLQEHNRLLGDETKAGQLSLRLNFDYGKKPDGNRRLAPLTLPDPPTELAANK